ncbi:MAG: hypothetical protein OER88_10055, partial [Planctomycetota bacterium]|nr:hypothetical protein [Planctomycetota bacterium]
RGVPESEVRGRRMKPLRRLVSVAPVADARRFVPARFTNPLRRVVSDTPAVDGRRVVLDRFTNPVGRLVTDREGVFTVRFAKPVGRLVTDREGVFTVRLANPVGRLVTDREGVFTVRFVKPVGRLVTPAVERRDGRFRLRKPLERPVVRDRWIVGERVGTRVLRRTEGELRRTEGELRRTEGELRRTFPKDRPRELPEAVRPDRPRKEPLRPLRESPCAAVGSALMPSARTPASKKAARRRKLERVMVASRVTRNSKRTAFTDE